MACVVQLLRCCQHDGSTACDPGTGSCNEDVFDLRRQSSRGSFVGSTDGSPSTHPMTTDTRWWNFSNHSSSEINSRSGGSVSGIFSGKSRAPQQSGGGLSRKLALRSMLADEGARAAELENGRLLDQFVLGSLLGQGSFGIVFACRRKGGNNPEELAVKMIDKVEMLPEDIYREVRTLESLAHPNILKVHEVVDEKCFVCIVTDRMWGGDLVQCIKSHHSAKKRIRVGKVLHLVRQMLDGIAYLHGRSIVHRDIKPDNFLLDRVSLMDGKCQVVLADFGFACECRVGDRLRRRCGTQSYWPPELWDRNYAQKVDVWALGATFFCIVEGAFPFLSEWETKHKEVVCHPLLSQKCTDLVKLLLCKDEASRPQALDALNHKWLNAQASDAAAEATDAIEWRRGAAIGVQGPDPAVTARRLELLERLEGTQLRRMAIAACEGRNNKFATSDSSLDSAHATPATILKNPTFKVVDKFTDKVRTFEWKPRSWILSRGLLYLGEESTGISPKMHKSTNSVRYSSATAVSQMLEAHGIDTSAFGQGSAKSLDRFADELESGASQLMMDAAKHKALVRVVDVVLVRLSIGHGDDLKYLIVAADEQLDGRVRSDLNRLPGTKKRPHENVRNAAERIVLELPDLDLDDVAFRFDAVEEFEEDEESPSYPGVRTVYRKQVVPGCFEAEIARKPTTETNGSGEMMHSSSRSTKFFTMLSAEECREKGVKLCAPKQGAEASSLVPAPIGLKVKALGRFLKAHSINPSAFGQDNTKTLQELSTELVTGESSLMTLPDNGVVRVVDVVLLVVTMQGTDSILVVTKEMNASGTGLEAQLNRLPGTKRRLDENHFHAAKRVLQRQLKVHENLITLDADNVQLFEEEKDSPSYPGLRTVYCKRIVSAELQVGPGFASSARSMGSSLVSKSGSLHSGVGVGAEGRPQELSTLLCRPPALCERVA